MGVDDSYTKALLHFDGSDASTTFTDESGKTWTAAGNAQIDTAQYKFGAASGLFDGTGDYIYTADSSDFYYGSGSFTVDFWVRFNALPAAADTQEIYMQYADASNRNQLYLYNNTGTYQWGVYSAAAAVGTNNFKKDSPGLSTGTWYHIAFVKNGTDFLIFQAGTQCGTTATSVADFGDIAAALWIGSYTGPSLGFNGWIDELRISKGIARWTSGFTPPTSAYTSTGRGFQIIGMG